MITWLNRLSRPRLRVAQTSALGREVSRVLARRHDNFSLRMALMHIGVDAVSVVRSCTLMLLFLYAMVEAQAVSSAGHEVAEASDHRLGIGE